MIFYTLYADGVEDIFLNDKIKRHNSIKELSVSKYRDFQLLETNTWKIAKSSEPKSNLPYLYEAWREINPLLYNNTVIMFDANFVVETIIKTYNYFINKSSTNEETCDENIRKELQNIKFDYMCLSLLCRRLFSDCPSNKLENLCKCTNIPYGNTSAQHSEAIGYLFTYITEKINSTDFMEIKHKSGITFGQLIKNISLRRVKKSKGKNAENKTEDENTENKIVEYDKYYTPCLAISDNVNEFRNYNFCKANEK